MLKTTFQHFSFFYEIFRNHWKSLEVLGCLRKSSEICRKVLKMTFQHVKSLEIIGSLQKSSEVFEKKRKMTESSQNNLQTLSEDFRKSSEVFGNARKTSEIFGKFLNVIGGLWNFFILFQFLTPVDWRLDSRILICNLHSYYAFCTGVTLLLHCSQPIRIE